MTQSVLAALIIVAFCVIMGTDDPTKQAYLGIYGLMALVGTVLIMFAQALVSVAIIVYFRKNHPEEHHWFETLLAPAIAFVAQIYVIYHRAVRQHGLPGRRLAASPTGSSGSTWRSLVIGILGAFYLKSADPQKYDKLGRMIYEGVPEK